MPELKRLAGSIGATPSQLALARLLAEPGVMVIPKSSDPARLRENLGARALTMDGALRQQIDALFPPPRRKQPLAMGWTMAPTRAWEAGAASPACHPPCASARPGRAGATLGLAHAGRRTRHRRTGRARRHARPRAGMRGPRAGASPAPAGRDAQVEPRVGGALQAHIDPGAPAGSKGCRTTRPIRLPCAWPRTLRAGCGSNSAPSA